VVGGDGGGFRFLHSYPSWDVNFHFTQVPRIPDIAPVLKFGRQILRQNFEKYLYSWSRFCPGAQAWTSDPMPKSPSFLQLNLFQQVLSESLSAGSFQAGFGSERNTFFCPVKPISMTMVKRAFAQSGSF
jgi:hypothetical protein